MIVLQENVVQRLGLDEHNLRIPGLSFDETVKLIQSDAKKLANWNKYLCKSVYSDLRITDDQINAATQIIKDQANRIWKICGVSKSGVNLAPAKAKGVGRDPSETYDFDVYGFILVDYNEVASSGKNVVKFLPLPKFRLKGTKFTRDEVRVLFRSAINGVS